MFCKKCFKRISTKTWNSNNGLCYSCKSKKKLNIRNKIKKLVK